LILSLCFEAIFRLRTCASEGCRLCSRPAGVTRRGVAANDIVGRGMRGRGRRSRRQCSGRALLGCDRRRDFRPSARASCPTSWHSHTHTPHANNVLCSAPCAPQPARHTHNNNSDFIYGPVCPNTQESALSFFLRAPPKLSSAPKNCSARVIVAEAELRCVLAAMPGGGWATRGGFCTRSQAPLAADSCRDADPAARALITDYHLSRRASSPLPGYIKVIRPQSVERRAAFRLSQIKLWAHGYMGGLIFGRLQLICTSDTLYWR
jgi:hypothetical protein